MKRGCSEMHTKRQATQHGCLSSQLGNGGKGIEKVYGEEKHILYWADYRATKAEQKSLVPARHALQTNRGKTPFICPLVSPYSPQFQPQVSKFSRVHPSLVSLDFLFLVLLALHASTKRFFCPAIVSPILTINYFNSCVPISQSSWAGSRAGSPVSQFVSLVAMMCTLTF